MPHRIPSSPWHHSLGTRLAAATALLVLLVAGGIYYALTRYQRAALLKAKSDAAVMMVELFAEVSSAPLLFADEQSVRDSVNYLRANPEVLEAAVFARAADGSLAPPLARLLRDRRADPQLTPPARERVGALQIFPEALEVSHWVRDPAGQTIGAVSVRLSLARENRSFALLSRRTLQISGGVALGVLLLLLLLARVYVVAPLRVVHGAVSSLSSGGQPPAALRELAEKKRGEIADLARGFLSMAEAIARREAAIARQNAEMTLILGNVGQGFLVLDAAGRIEGQHSAILERWFGRVPAGTPLWSYLAPHDPEQAQWLELAWSNLQPGLGGARGSTPFMPADLCVAQMPRSFVADGNHYDIEYRPLWAGQEQLDKMVVVISDVSELREREAGERAQRELVAVFDALVRDRAGFVGCCEDAGALVDAIAARAQPAQVLLERLHTLKGNAWLFKLNALAQACERIEQSCAEERRGPTPEQAEELSRALAHSTRVVRPFLSPDSAHAVSLRSEDFQAIEQALRSGEPGRAVLERLTRATAEPAAQVFGRLLAQLEPLARRLGKCAVETQIEDGGVRFPRARFAPLWAVMVHALRNVADHALETEWEREQSRKPSTARVSLSAQHEAGRLRIRLRDDGRGIDWDAVREKARARGLPADTHAQLVDALLRNGFSTRDTQSELSGRGVGLSALAREVERLGGRLSLSSERGQGTELSVDLPGTLLRASLELAV